LVDKTSLAKDFFMQYATGLRGDLPKMAQNDRSVANKALNR